MRQVERMVGLVVEMVALMRVVVKMACTNSLKPIPSYTRPSSTS